MFRRLIDKLTKKSKDKREDDWEDVTQDMMTSVVTTHDLAYIQPATKVTVPTKTPRSQISSIVKTPKSTSCSTTHSIGHSVISKQNVLTTANTNSSNSPSTNITSPKRKQYSDEAGLTVETRSNITTPARITKGPETTVGTIGFSTITYPPKRKQHSAGLTNQAPSTKTTSARATQLPATAAVDKIDYSTITTSTTRKIPSVSSASVRTESLYIGTKPSYSKIATLTNPLTLAEIRLNSTSTHSVSSPRPKASFTSCTNTSLFQPNSRSPIASPRGQRSDTHDNYMSTPSIVSRLPHTTSSSIRQISPTKYRQSTPLFSQITDAGDNSFTRYDGDSMYYEHDKGMMQHIMNDMTTEDNTGIDGTASKRNASNFSNSSYNAGDVEMKYVPSSALMESLQNYPNVPHSHTYDKSTNEVENSSFHKLGIHVDLPSYVRRSTATLTTPDSIIETTEEHRRINDPQQQTSLITLGAVEIPPKTPRSQISSIVKTTTNTSCSTTHSIGHNHDNILRKHNVFTTATTSSKNSLFTNTTSPKRKQYSDTTDSGTAGLTNQTSTTIQIPSKAGTHFSSAASSNINHPASIKIPSDSGTSLIQVYSTSATTESLYAETKPAYSTIATLTKKTNSLTPAGIQLNSTSTTSVSSARPKTSRTSCTTSSSIRQISPTQYHQNTPLFSQTTATCDSPFTRYDGDSMYNEHIKGMTQHRTEDMTTEDNTDIDGTAKNVSDFSNGSYDESDVETLSSSASSASSSMESLHSYSNGPRWCSKQLVYTYDKNINKVTNSGFPKLGIHIDSPSYVQHSTTTVPTPNSITETTQKQRRINVPQQQSTLGMVDVELYVGKVCKIQGDKGFGFITPDALPADFVQKDVYFRFNCIRGRHLQLEDDVVFTLKANSRDKPACHLLRHIDEDQSIFKHSHSYKQRDQHEQHHTERSTTHPIASPLNQSKDVGLDHYSSQMNVHQSGCHSLNKKGVHTSKYSKIVAETQLRFNISRHPCHGKVIFVTKDRKQGILKPTKMPTGYLTGTNAMFLINQVQNGHLELVEGDLLGFTTETKTKNKDKLLAFNVQLLQCTPRRANIITKWILHSLETLHLHAEGKIMNKTKYAIDILTCEAIWLMIGKSKDPPDKLISELLNLLVYIYSECVNLRTYYTGVLHTLVHTPLFSSSKGQFKYYVEKYLSRSSHLTTPIETLCEMLAIFVKLVPERAKLFVSYLSFSNHTISPYEHVLYKTLCEFTNTCCQETDDMDWNEMPLVLNVSELSSGILDILDKLRPVVDCGSYSSEPDYMDIYFRLLRADCFYPLKKGIHGFLKGELDERDMHVYYNVNVVGVNFTSNNMELGLHFTTRKKVKDWRTTTHLKFGNLLCLSPSGTFSDPIWAIISNRDTLVKNNMVMVELLSECNSMFDSAAIMQLHGQSGHTIMVESPTYYRAYQPVLKSLQHLKLDELPFSYELVNGMEYGHPHYLELYPHASVDASIIYSNAGQMNILQLAENDDRSYDTTLDISQESALKQALSNRVAIIQGPPGTGKTFIGTKLVRLLLSCDELPCGPILVLTYKNHALDDFLRGLLEDNITNIIRVGGRSQAGHLDKYNMKEVKKEKKNRMKRDMYQKWMEIKNKIDDSRSRLEKAFQNMEQSRCLNERQLLECLTAKQLRNLMNGPSNTSNNIVINQNNQSEKLLLDDVCLEIALDNLQKWLPGIKPVIAVENELKSYLTHQNVFSASFNDVLDDETDDFLNESDIKLQLEEPIAADALTGCNDGGDVMNKMHTMKTNKDSCLSMLNGMLKAAKVEPIHVIRNVENIWKLDDKKRVQFIQSNIVENFEVNASLFQEELVIFRALCKEQNAIESQHKGQIAAEVDVLAMTITGANINRDIIEIARPPIIIVEEAAEVLEPQIVSVLGEWVQQLILIGDHKQLRPSVETYELKKIFNFDLSLMERLINNEFPYQTLLMQNRMRPEFAELLLDIYPDLRSNLARVGQNAAPKCTSTSMFFWDHNFKETSERSYTNDEEAKRAVQLSLFMLMQGYKPNKITILGAYQGQVALIRNKMRAAKQKHPQCFETTQGVDSIEDKDNQVSVLTIDMYQGDENDIVIVSLVRCNKKKQTGFLKFLSRRCVAQSRAKCGMFIIGSASTLRSTCWNTLISNMDDMKCVSKCLPLCCPSHRQETEIKVANADSIPLTGFCTLPCVFRMSCGIHSCSQPCQPIHEHNRCREIIAFTFARCGHGSKRKCSDDIKDLRCTFKMSMVKLPCGHRGNKLCSQKTTDVTCNNICSKKLPCKHLCQNKCCQPCNTTECKECKKILEIKVQLKLREQEQLLKEMKRETSLTIRELVSEQSRLTDMGDPSFTSASLKEVKSTGDSASEYFNVEDKVKRYIQPDHNWFPHITKIEKVNNSNLELKFYRRRLMLCDGTRIESKFHGTDAIDNIIQEGFRMPQKAGMYGRGIYFATDSSKSAQNKYTKGSNKLLLCDVLIGRSLTVECSQRDMTLQILKAKNYDSLFAKRDTRKTRGVLFDEYIVYHEDQALPRYIISYQLTNSL